MKHKIFLFLLIGILFTVSAAGEDFCNTATIVRGTVTMSDGSPPGGADIIAYVNESEAGRSKVPLLGRGYVIYLQNISKGEASVTLIATKDDKQGSINIKISCGDNKEIPITISMSGNGETNPPASNNTTPAGNANNNSSSSGEVVNPPSGNPPSGEVVNPPSGNSSSGEVVNPSSGDSPSGNPPSGEVVNPSSGNPPSGNPPSGEVVNPPSGNPSSGEIVNPSSGGIVNYPVTKPKPSVSGLYLAVSPLNAKSGENIEIKVTYNNNPVPDAKIKIILPNGATVNEKTNSEGVFVTRLQAGDATITVDSNGDTASKKITVEGGGLSYLWILIILIIILIPAYVILKRTRD